MASIHDKASNLNVNLRDEFDKILTLCNILAKYTENSKFYLSALPVFLIEINY